MTNDALRAVLVDRVIASLSHTVGVKGEPKVSQWSILDFSSVFSVEWRSDIGPVGVFVKVPKSEINRRTVEPNTDADRLMARREFASLTQLARDWLGVRGETRFIEPLAFYEEWNAIVTRRFYGLDLLGAFRKVGRTAPTPGAILVRQLRDIGCALQGFHARSPVQDAGRRADAILFIRKIDQIVSDLKRLGAHGVVWDHRHVDVSQWDDAGSVFTLKGLDIRNVLVNERGSLGLLDPGPLKADVPEADLARLLTTCRIIYWGKPAFVQGAAPHPDWEASVLDGYGRTHLNPIRLDWLRVKELYKHWRAAHVAVSLKRWPSPAAWLARRVYVDRFYRRDIAALTARVIAGSGRG